MILIFDRRKGIPHFIIVYAQCHPFLKCLRMLSAVTAVFRFVFFKRFSTAKTGRLLHKDDFLTAFWTNKTLLVF